MGRPGCRQCCDEEDIIDCNIGLDITYTSTNNEEMFLSKEDFLNVIATTDDEKPEDAPEDYDDRVMPSEYVDSLFSDYYVFNYGETLSRVSIELEKEDTYSFSFLVNCSQFYRLADRMELKTANREVFCKYSNTLADITPEEGRFFKTSTFDLEILDSKYLDTNRQLSIGDYSASLGIDISPDILNVYSNGYTRRREGSFVSLAVKEEVGEYITEDELLKFSSEVIFNETKFVQEVNRSDFVNSGELENGLTPLSDLSKLFSRIITYDKDLNLVKIFVIMRKDLITADASYKDYRASRGAIEVGDFTSDFVDTLANRKKEETIRTNSHLYMGIELNNKLGYRYIYVSTEEDEDEENNVFYLTKLKDDLKELISDSEFLPTNFSSLAYRGSSEITQSFDITLEDYLEDIDTIFLDSDFLETLTGGKIDEDRIDEILSLIVYKKPHFKYIQNDSTAEFDSFGFGNVDGYLYNSTLGSAFSNLNPLQKPNYPIITFENGKYLNKVQRTIRAEYVNPNNIPVRNRPTVTKLLTINILYDSISGTFMNGEDIYLKIIDPNLGFNDKTAFVGKQFFIRSFCGSVVLRPWIPYYGRKDYKDIEEETYGEELVHNYSTNSLYYGSTTYTRNTVNETCSGGYSHSCYCCTNNDVICENSYRIYDSFEVEPYEQVTRLGTSNDFLNPSPFDEGIGWVGDQTTYNPNKINSSVVLEDPNDGFLKRGYIYNRVFYESFDEAKRAMIDDIPSRRKGDPFGVNDFGNPEFFENLDGTISTFLYHKFPNELPSIKTHDYASQWPSVFCYDIIPRLNRIDPTPSYVGELSGTFLETNLGGGFVNQSDKLYDVPNGYVFDKTALLWDDPNICIYSYYMSVYVDEPIIAANRSVINEYDNILVRPSKKEYYTYAYSSRRRTSMHKDESERVGIFDDITDLKKSIVDFNVHKILFSKPDSKANLSILPAGSITENLRAFWNEGKSIVFDASSYSLAVGTSDLQEASTLYSRSKNNELISHPFFKIDSGRGGSCETITYEDKLANNQVSGGFGLVVKEGGGTDSFTRDFYTSGCRGDGPPTKLGEIQEYSISSNFRRLNIEVTGPNYTNGVFTSRGLGSIYQQTITDRNRVNIDFVAENPFGDNFPIMVPTSSISMSDGGYLINHKLYKVDQSIVNGLTHYSYITGFEFDIYQGMTYDTFPKYNVAYERNCNDCGGYYYPVPLYDTLCGGTAYTTSLELEFDCDKDGSFETLINYPSCRDYICEEGEACPGSGSWGRFKSASISTTFSQARSYFHAIATLDNKQSSPISLKDIGSNNIKLISPSSLEWDYKLRMFKW